MTAERLWAGTTADAWGVGQLDGAGHLQGSCCAAWRELPFVGAKAAKSFAWGAVEQRQGRWDLRDA